MDEVVFWAVFWPVLGALLVAGIIGVVTNRPLVTALSALAMVALGTLVILQGSKPKKRTVKDAKKEPSDFVESYADPTSLESRDRVIDSSREGFIDGVRDRARDDVRRIFGDKGDTRN